MIYLIITGTREEYDDAVTKYLTDTDADRKRRGMPPIKYIRSPFRLEVGRDNFVYIEKSGQMLEMRSIFIGQKFQVIFWGTAMKRRDIKEFQALVPRVTAP